MNRQLDKSHLQDRPAEPATEHGQDGTVRSLSFFFHKGLNRRSHGQSEQSTAFYPD